ncbi:glycosyltransferase family 9 protein [Streptomyces lateritius]|uniref:Glycosyltransferase family 9 protein n=1 Tax=Streptomyces lateritius TaxID=67313 RepID=A0ABW6YGR6_9ACTN
MAGDGTAGAASAPCGRGGRRPTVLVLRALGLGDVLTSVPALRALRRGFPGHEIVLAGPASLAAVTGATGAVDRMLPTRAPGREVPAELPWSGPPPDLAVDLHGCGPLSHRLLERTGAGALWAFRHADMPALDGPRWRPDEHERERWCRLLRWYGLAADPDELCIPAPTVPSPAPGAVVLHPGADSGARRWPAERYAAVAGALRRAGQRVVVTAGPGEEAAAAAVAARAGLSPAEVLGGPEGVPFARLCALLARSRCVVVGDTGIAHLASALGARSVVLFGPVSPRLWGPPTAGPHRSLWHPFPGDDPLRPGDPHGTTPDPRLLRVSVEEVLGAVESLTGRAGGTAGAVLSGDTPRPHASGRPGGAGSLGGEQPAGGGGRPEGEGGRAAGPVRTGS